VGHTLQTIANEESAKWIMENNLDGLFFTNYEEYFDFVCSKVKNLVASLSNNQLQNCTILEFGVWKGFSITKLSNQFPSLQLVGFDSFEGLSEDWKGTDHTAGHFDLKGMLPKVPTNVALVKGHIPESFETHQRYYPNQKYLLVNIDTDTKSPAKEILTRIREHLIPGSVVMFDEFHGYYGWKMGEWAAFQEFLSETPISFNYLAFTDTRACIQIV